MASTDQFEAFFQEADTDEDGYLTFDELVTVLRKHDYAGDDDQIRVSGSISFIELGNTVCPSVRPASDCLL